MAPTSSFFQSRQGGSLSEPPPPARPTPSQARSLRQQYAAPSETPTGVPVQLNPQILQEKEIIEQRKRRLRTLKYATLIIVGIFVIIGFIYFGVTYHPRDDDGSGASNTSSSASVANGTPTSSGQVPQATTASNAVDEVVNKFTVRSILERYPSLRV